MLVANAALPSTGRITDLTDEQVARMLRINLESPILLAQALLPGMLERGRGKLVMIGLLAGKAGSPRSSIYNATSRFARLRLRARCGPGRFPVSITLVAPGFVREAGMSRDPEPTPCPASARPPPKGWPKQCPGRRLEEDRDRRRTPGPADHGLHRADQPARLPLGPVGPGRPPRPPTRWSPARPTNVDPHPLKTEKRTMSSNSKDSFSSKDTLETGGRSMRSSVSTP